MLNNSLRSMTWAKCCRELSTNLVTYNSGTSECSRPISHKSIGRIFCTMTTIRNTNIPRERTLNFAVIGLAALKSFVSLSISLFPSASSIAQATMGQSCRIFGFYFKANICVELLLLVLLLLLLQ